MAVIDFSFIGKGRTFLNPFGGGAGGWEVGNCSELSVQVTEQTQDLLNFQVAGGGKANQLRRVESVGLTMNMRDFNATNLALALLGDASLAAAGSVTDEAHTAHLGALIRTAFGDISSVVVTDSPETTTYTAGTDYEVLSAGIIPLAGGAISEDDALLIDYDHGAQQVIQALTHSANEYVLHFDGLNEAQSGKPVIVDVWRAKFGATGGLSLIGDDFGENSLTGEALSDASRGGGLSQFLTWQYTE